MYLVNENRFFNLRFIKAHAPTEYKGDDLKEEFCQLLNYAYNVIPNNDMKVIIRELNVKFSRKS